MGVRRFMFIRGGWSSPYKCLSSGSLPHNGMLEDVDTTSGSCPVAPPEEFTYGTGIITLRDTGGHCTTAGPILIHTRGLQLAA